MQSIYNDIAELEDNEKILAQFVTNIVLEKTETANELSEDVKQQIRSAIESFKQKAENEDESLNDLLANTLKSTCCQ